ncbi:MAG: hypothetical protein ACI6PR_05745 [Pseudoalteromonas sp.]|uniref:hypothetical protein n=1 Tax=Pseudoalteromonas sp. TaxID=53249 RepID=UPI00384CAAE5
MLEELEGRIESLEETINQASELLKINTGLKKSEIESSSKITDIISSTGTFDIIEGPSYLLRTKPINLKLLRPLLVSKIELTLSSRKAVELTYIDTSGVKKAQISDDFKKTEKSGLYKLVFSVIAPIEEFSISTVDGEVNLRSLQGFVFNESDSYSSLSKLIDKLYLIQEESYELLTELNDELGNLTNRKHQLDEVETEYQDRLSSIQYEIENKEDLLNEVNDELNSLKSQLVNIKDQLAETTASLKLNREENGSLEQSNKTYSESLESLKKEVRSQTTKLKSLQEDVDIFSEDFKSFTGETRKQQLFYGVISLVLLSVLIFITNSLFEKAGDLITLFDEGKIESIWNIFLSRIPFMFAVLGIVAFIAEGMRRCLNQIIALHEQRLSFLRLSIVSREVIDSSTNEIDLDKESIVKLRAKLKLAMLRQHMEKDLGKKEVNFEQPSQKVTQIKSNENNQGAA